MAVQNGRSQEEFIQALQQQVDELTAENQALKDQHAQNERFIAMIAHELRGPLSPIINYAQMLSRQASTNTRISTREQDTTAKEQSNRSNRGDPVQRATGIIIGQARRLTRLVNDLLDSSCLTSGQFALVCESCDIAILVQEVVEQVRPLAPYHTFIIDVPEYPIMGNWDSGRLQQVLGNLLDNAIKYSDERTVITTRVWTTSGYAHASVHNQGTSIPSADIGQLFRPYARLQATSARRGSGLGLHIAKSIIEAHSGSLHLEAHNEEMASEGPRGTTFIFDLPLPV